MSALYRLLLILMLAFSIASKLLAFPTEGVVDLEGKPATIVHAKNKELVAFWATWCTSCKEELKTALPELAKRHDLAVIAVSTDDERERVQHFVKKNHVALPVYHDAQRKLQDSLQVSGVPFWAFYTRSDDKAPWKLVESGSGFNAERINVLLKP